MPEAPVKNEAQRRVNEVMVTNLHAIDGLATVEEALRAMRRHGVSSLVVTRRNADDEVGLLEVSGVADMVAASRPIARANVYEAMTKPVVTLPPDMLVRYAVRLLRQHGLSRAVVVDEKRDAVGMVTLRDLILASVDVDGEDEGREEGREKESRE